MELEEFYDYKNRFMEELCKNEDIVKIVTWNSNADVPNHKLPYSQFFPYEYVPETENDSRIFICFDVDIVSVPNKTYYLPVLYVWVFAHKSKMRLPQGGVTIDALASKIDKMLNGSRFYGLGALDLDSVRRFTPITDYLGRALTYYAKDYNRAPNQRPVPNNRKRGE